jgi:hypothetical protein
MKNTILILVSLIFSAYIGYSDLSQTDTPITVAMILVASFVIGFFASKRIWAYAIIIGIGVPVAGFLAAYYHWQLSGIEHGQIKILYATYDNAGISLVTIPLALIGAYIGQAIKKLLHRSVTD